VYEKNGEGCGDLLCFDGVIEFGSYVEFSTSSGTNLRNGRLDGDYSTGEII
jgi:hypothetical protein